MRSPRSVSTTSMPRASRCGLSPHSSVSIDLLFTTRAHAALAQQPRHDRVVLGGVPGPVHDGAERGSPGARTRPRQLAASVRERLAADRRGRARAAPPSRAAPPPRRRAARARTRAPRRARRARGVGEKARRAPTDGRRSTAAPGPPGSRRRGGMRSGLPRRSARPRGGAGTRRRSRSATSAPAALVVRQAVEAHAAGDVRLLDREDAAEAAALVAARGRDELEAAEGGEQRPRTLSNAGATRSDGRARPSSRSAWQLGCRPTRCGKRPATPRTREHVRPGTRRARGRGPRAAPRRRAGAGTGGAPSPTQLPEGHTTARGPRRRAAKRRARARASSGSPAVEKG